MKSVTPEPDFGLALINSVIQQDFDRIRKYVADEVAEADDLAIIDVSVLEVLGALTQRVQKFARIPHLAQETWLAVIKESRAFPKKVPVNPNWLRTEIDTFISNILNPYINTGVFELDLPETSEERGTIEDEFLIHAYAVAFAGAAFVKGISSTISGYGTPSEILSRLHEYFELMASRGAEYASVDLATEDER